MPMFLQHGDTYRQYIELSPYSSTPGDEDEAEEPEDEGQRAHYLVIPWDLSITRESENQYSVSGQEWDCFELADSEREILPDRPRGSDLAAETFASMPLFDGPWTAFELLFDWHIYHKGAAADLVRTEEAAQAIHTLFKLFADDPFGKGHNDWLRHILQDFAGTGNADVSFILATHTMTPAVTLEQFLPKANDNLRALITQHPAFPHPPVSDPPSPLSIRDYFWMPEFTHAVDQMLLRPDLPSTYLWAFVEDEQYLVQAKVAAHPAATPEMLERLSHSSFLSVLRRVAAHPSTSAEVLTRLAGHLDEDVRASVATNLKVPPEVLRTLGTDVSTKVRVRVVQHSQTALEDLQRLWEGDSTPWVREAAQATLWDRLPAVEVLEVKHSKPERENQAETVELPGDLGARPQPEVDQPVAETGQESSGTEQARGDETDPGDTGKPTGQQDLLQGSPALHLEAQPSPPSLQTRPREDAAADPLTPLEDLLRLAQDGSACVRFGVASNWRVDLPEDVLRTLALDGDEAVRMAASGHPSWSLAGLQQVTLEYLTQRRPSEAVQPAEAVQPDLYSEPLLMTTSEWCNYQGACAQDPQTPAHELRTLARNRSPYVRVKLTSNPAVPGDLLDELGWSLQVLVRLGVASHPAASLSCLCTLATDLDPKVAFMASETLHTQILSRSLNDDEAREIVAIGDEPLNAVLLRHPDLSAEVLNELATREGGEHRKQVIGHPNTSAVTRQRLLEDQALALSMADDPDTSPLVLTLMAHLPLPELHMNIVAHPNTPAEALVQLAQFLPLPDQGTAGHPGAPFASGASSLLPSVRVLMAQHPATPPKVLGQLALNADEEIQQALLENPRTPFRTLEEIRVLQEAAAQQGKWSWRKGLNPWKKNR
jgi:hypothetical protein